MISGTITDILQNKDSIEIIYSLNDDADARYSIGGSFLISLGWSAAEINAKLVGIVDVANYVASLKPLLMVKIESPNPAPLPVTPILPPIHMDSQQEVP